jgi:hypothetical protein
LAAISYEVLAAIKKLEKRLDLYGYSNLLKKKLRNIEDLKDLKDGCQIFQHYN